MWLWIHLSVHTGNEESHVDRGVAPQRIHLPSTPVTMPWKSDSVSVKLTVHSVGCVQMEVYWFFLSEFNDYDLWLDTSWSVFFFLFHGQIEWVGQFWIWFQNYRNLWLGCLYTSATSWHWQLRSHFKSSITLVKHKLSRSRTGLSALCLLKSLSKISRSPKENIN